MYRSSNNCGDTDEDTDKDDECRDTKPSKNTPPSFRFLRLGNHTTRRTPNSNWTATCNLFLPSIEGSLPENIVGRQPQFQSKIVPKNFRKKLYVSSNRRIHRCYRALALVRDRRASLAQCELGKDQRRNCSRKKPAPSPLQRALKQE